MSGQYPSTKLTTNLKQPAHSSTSPLNTHLVVHLKPALHLAYCATKKELNAIEDIKAWIHCIVILDLQLTMHQKQITSSMVQAMKMATKLSQMTQCPAHVHTTTTAMTTLNTMVPTTSFVGFITLPKLTQPKKDLDQHQGCYKCRMFYARHFSCTCMNKRPTLLRASLDVKNWVHLALLRATGGCWKNSVTANKYCDWWLINQCQWQCPLMILTSIDIFFTMLCLTDLSSNHYGSASICCQWHYNSWCIKNASKEVVKLRGYWPHRFHLQALFWSLRSGEFQAQLLDDSQRAYWQQASWFSKDCGCHQKQVYNSV